MRLTRTAVIGTNASFQLVSTENPVSFGDLAFSMDPLWFNGVEPRAFRGQKARENTDALTCLLDRLIMLAEPITNDLTFVPRGVIPDQYQGCDILGRQVLTTGSQEIDGDRTHRTTIYKAQQHLICLRGPSQEQSVTSQCHGIAVLLAAC